MKNTTFRKKALLSSVAMLLVALVALGSATFAWFAANPNANASGLSLKTTAASGLVIKTTTDTTWSHEAKLYKGQTDPYDLQPVSQNQATAANFVTVEAAASDKWEMKKGADINTASKSAYYAEDVFFKLTTGSAAEPTAKVNVTGVTITMADLAEGENDPALFNAIRVAVADASGKVIATYAPNTAGANGVLTGKDAEGNPTTEAFTKLDTVGTGKKDDCGFTGLTVAEDASKKVTVYVYLDGQDTCCKSDNVTAVDAREIVKSVQVDFSLVK